MSKRWAGGNAGPSCGIFRVMGLVPIGVFLRRRSAQLLAGALAACGSSDAGGTGRGAISLFVDRAGASIQQSSSTLVVASLTRSGGFTGPVAITVTGAPAGVSASAANFQTLGVVTTAGVTISADATTTPGTYALLIHGIGDGVSEATAAFTLTVTALPSGFSVSLSATAVSIGQGESAPTITITITRVNFTAPVIMTVTGVPDNVTAGFAPSTVTGNSSVLTLTVGAAALPGLYHLVVIGTASNGPQSTPLRLTVTAPAPAPGNEPPGSFSAPSMY
jgi:hypothetical protein